MIDRNSSKYVQRRGMPTCVLSRAYDKSSIDSDGASRTFYSTHPTITPAIDIDSSDMSNISYSLSFFSMVSIEHSSEWSSNLGSNICQSESSSFTFSVFD